MPRPGRPDTINAVHPYSAKQTRVTPNPISRRLLLGGVGLLAGGLLAGTTPATAAVPAARRRIHLTLPPPTGPHAVGTAPLHLVTPAGRELMISLWYPTRHVRGHAVAPWLSAGVAGPYLAAQGLPTELVLPATHGHLGAPVNRCAGRLPVVLYSPGNNAFRSANTIIVEELASRGYLVVTIDHTGDAYVEFPDGRVLTPIPDGPDTQWIAAARVADVRHVLDVLGRLDAGVSPDVQHGELPSGLRGGIDRHRIGIAGYSAGGVTVASTMYADTRIAAGLSLDGGVAGPVVTAGLNRPFLLMTATKAIRSAVPELAEFWAALRGWKRNIAMDDVAHASYADDEALVPQLTTGDETTKLIGSADPARVLAVQRAYPLAFFDQHLRHHGHLLDRPSPRYPDVHFIP